MSDFILYFCANAEISANILTDGVVYFKNRILHRDNGPAIEYLDGTKEWRKNGFLHRTDGPAVKFPNGRKEYWIDGKKYSKKNYYRVIKLLFLI